MLRAVKECIVNIWIPREGRYQGYSGVDRSSWGAGFPGGIGVCGEVCWIGFGMGRMKRRAIREEPELP